MARSKTDGYLTAAERESIERYASATRPWACDGCDRLCGVRECIGG